MFLNNPNGASAFLEQWFKLVRPNFRAIRFFFIREKANLLKFAKRRVKRENIKHLMTGPKGNSEFCFPETLNVPRGEAEGNIEVEGKQNPLFPEGPVIKCLVIPPNSK